MQPFSPEKTRGSYSSWEAPALALCFCLKSRRRAAPAPAVFCASFGLIQVAFAKRAFKDPDLWMAHNVHKISFLGGALFIADDIFPETPFLHAGWHLAAAVGVDTCNKLLE